MGWLKAITNALVGSLIALVLAAAFQAPLLDYFNRDRLTARFEAGPWIEKPRLRTDETRLAYDKGNAVGAAVKSFVGSLSDQNFDGQWYEAGKLTITNRSKKEITAIRINYTSLSAPDLLVMPENKDQSYFVKSANDIKLPDMKPGDRVTIFQWSTISPNLTDVNMKTYSSEGDFRINFDFPTTVSTNVAGQFFSLIFDYIWFIMLIFVIIIFIMLMVQIDFLVLYYKKLLSDDDAYLSERERFEADREKFSPTAKQSAS